MEWFDDIFDVLDIDDDNDAELSNALEEYNQDFDFDYLHTNVDEELMVIEDDSLIDDDHGSKVRLIYTCCKYDIRYSPII
jgi:hypothetical protein